MNYVTMFNSENCPLSFASGTVPARGWGSVDSDAVDVQSCVQKGWLIEVPKPDEGDIGGDASAAFIMTDQKIADNGDPEPDNQNTVTSPDQPESEPVVGTSRATNSKKKV